MPKGSPGDETPSATAFLFVNRDARNIHSRGHIGAVNAHVHADARAKKNQKSTARHPSDSPISLRQSISTWRVRTLPEHVHVVSPPNDRENLPPQTASDNSSSQAASSSPALSIASLCNSPSTLPGSGPPTPKQTSLAIQFSDKRVRTRQRERRHPPGRATKKPNVSPLLETAIVKAEPTAFNASIGTYVGSNSLDPFCHFPTEITENERILCQHYLTYISRLVYGTCDHAMFCPVRTVTFGNALKYPLVLQWMIIGSEAYLAARGGFPEPASLLRRKAKVYREMNQNLSHPVERFSEGIFIAVSGAIIVNSRVMGPEVASLHLRGMETLVANRGGLESFYRENPATDCVFFFVWAHHVCNGGGIGVRTELDLYRSDFLQTLRDMQSWNKQLRSDLKRLNVHRLWNDSNPTLSSNTTQGVQSQATMLEAYAASRTKTFAPSAVLAPHIDPDYTFENSVERTCHFSNIYTINLTLWTFREDHNAGISFLNRIRKHMDENGVRDPETGITSLTLSALVWMLRKARFEVDNTGEQAQSREVWMTWKIIHALKIMALLNEDTRKRLVKTMSAWLTQDDLHTMFDLPERDLSLINEEIGRNWQAQAG